MTGTLSSCWPTTRLPDPGTQQGRLTLPLTFTAPLKANQRYANAEASRVGELNDAVFVDASDHLSTLITDLNAATGAVVTPQSLAAAILQVLKTGIVPLADAAATDLRRLTVAGPKRHTRPNPGDLPAIPAGRSGYRLAVVVARNRFGTALGIFPGTSPQPRLPTAVQKAAPGPHPVYTGDNLVHEGVWRVIGHDETLLALFPTKPARSASRTLLPARPPPRRAPAMARGTRGLVKLSTSGCRRGREGYGQVPPVHGQIFGS
jgi:hypothetical protein